ncbi:glutathione S-transferase-like [Macrosteles quadrilineatus]|uniref:glutathione S-transferase-like n=1 Tax=Macrosteles quadrilineatus TaxID=74068 RepID=UPI0023E2444D|nr:glutathione S-transferase-like [Macrosteles quadrilineatus]
MAPKYKLTYFNLKGICEPIRFLLEILEADYEEVRMEFGDWPAKKAETPFGKVPLLEVDGKLMHQSLAIERYLGRLAGLTGADAWEDAQIDIMADTITDFRVPIPMYMWEPNEELKNTRKATFVKETLPFFLKKFDNIVKENGGYLANKKLSWADILFAALTEYVSYAVDVQDVTDGYPNLKALRDKVYSLPQIKKYLAKRPQTTF